VIDASEGKPFTGLPAGFAEPNLYAFTLPPSAASVTFTLASDAGAPPAVWVSAAGVPDANRRRRGRPAGGGLVPMVNPLGYAAAEAAWLHGDAWRRQLIAVLERHRDMVLETVRGIPGLSAAAPQATYLVWIDCRGTGVADPQAACEAAGLGPSDGQDFGFPGFIRLNTGCPTARLEEALRRLARAFSRH
jgi:cystathionine beta-lyase